MPGFVPIEELFKGRHFDQEIVVLCVRWYLSLTWVHTATPSARLLHGRVNGGSYRYLLTP
jgi:hypothetical protein